MSVPWFLTYFSILGHYPSEEVLGATVPWLVMLQGFPLVFIIIFGVVVGWTLIERASGMIHAFVVRLDARMHDMIKKRLTAAQKGMFAVGTLILAIVLAQVGFIDIIS